MSSINDNKKLLQKSLVKEYIAKAEKGILDKQWEVYKEKLLDKERQNTIRNLNERQYYITFLTDLFVNVLGHKLAPDKNHNISIEEKNVSDAGRADGAIYIDDKVAAVIELKSTKTKNINEVTKQGFDYKNNHKGCRIVIISNFETLRIYVDYKIDYEEYNLFNLDKEKFYELYILLSFQGMKNGVLLDIYEKTQGNEVDITNKLYADYSAFKKALYEDIVTNNPDLDKQVLYKKTQKLIDRILFILFAERRGLLPVNTIANMLKTFEDSYKMQFCDDLYSVFKKWFGFINSGNDRMQPHIFDYNGGLFAEDDVLDNIVISDKVLKDNCNVLIKYDYESEVDVNILGHIFEQSLGENDKKKAEQNGKKKAKNNGIRNQYGIFYTAKYITHYIVENTIGKLCQEKKNELKWNELEQNIAELKGKKDNKTIKAQKREYEIIIDSYREWLLTLKILDPACGSGAFLNEALSFLIEEHKSLDELKNELATGGAGLEFTEIEKKVLEQNIFGVDINEESVEIAKLSLWLRTAKQGRKLSKLSNNIKCGNSLISDPEVAGEKAFDWNSEFPDIMQNGGFDVVIGNPPYGITFKNNEKEYLRQYDDLVPDYEAYIYFISLYKKILKNNGYLSYIFPNTFLSNLYGERYRNELINNSTIELITDLSTDNTFIDAKVRTCIVALRREINEEYSTNLTRINNEEFTNFSTVTKAELITNCTNILALFHLYNEDAEVIRKIRNNTTLNNYFTVSQGLIPYDQYRGHDEETINNRIWHTNYQKDKTYKKELAGKDVTRYNIEWNGESWISYGEWLAAPREEKFFKNPRVLIREITSERLLCCYTEEEYYNTPSIINIIDENNVLDLKYLLAILNSKIIGWLHNKTSPKAKKGLFPKILIRDVRNLPIKALSPEEQAPFISLADKMLKLNKQLQEKVQKFVDLMKTTLNVEVKNDVFDKSENEFIKKIEQKTSVSKLQEWLLLFRQYKGEAKALKDEIESTDKTIDAMVYDLYGLSEDEIKIVEA